MTMRPEEYYVSPTPDGFAPFLRREVTPPVDSTRLAMRLLVGEQRKTLKIPTTGELSLALSYKNKEGYLASFADHGEALGILQLQGAEGGKGYRVATGVKLPQLFASQIHEITTHPESPYRELYMPPVTMIEGVEVALSELATLRYEALAAELGMKFSAQEQLFIKKLK